MVLIARPVSKSRQKQAERLYPWPCLRFDRYLAQRFVQQRVQRDP